MTTSTNGSRMAVKVMGGIIASGVLAVGGWQAGRVETIIKDLNEHQGTDGHPVMIERVNTLSSKVEHNTATLDVIRRDQRSIRESQIEQGVLLRDISKKLDK